MIQLTLQSEINFYFLKEKLFWYLGHANRKILLLKNTIEKQQMLFVRKTFWNFYNKSILPFHSS